MSGYNMDAGQILKAAFDEDNQALRVNVVDEDALAMIGGANLDSGQVLKQIFDSDNQALRINIVQGGGGGDSANTALSNLVAPTAINQPLLPAPSMLNTLDMGELTNPFRSLYTRELYLVNVGTGVFTSLNQSAPASNISIELPSINSTLAILGAQTFTGDQTFSAQIRMANGTVSQPSIVFTSDDDGTGTGLYRSATDTIAFSTAGTLRGSINATGNYAIGPAAGLGTSGAAYHSMFGSMVGNNSATIAHSTANRGRKILASNVFTDSAGTLKAIAADTGYTYMTIDTRNSAGGGAFTFNSNHTNLQTANNALSAGGEINTGIISAAGSWTLGPAGNTVAHTVNGAISYPKINDTSTGTITALVSLNRNHIKLTASTTITLQGVVAGTEGQRITLINLTGNTMTLQNDTTATAANRIYTPGAVDLLVRNQGSVDLIYDTTAQRWFTGQI